MQSKINLVLNMETADFDDILTLCFVGGDHPKINLLGVVVTPGSQDQVFLVKHVLNKMLNKNIPVGVYKPKHLKQCVSEFHYKWIDKSHIEMAKHDGLGSKVISEIKKQYPDVVLLSGAPLGCIYQALFDENVEDIKEIVIQGGFAGCDVVPSEFVLEKFKNKIVCPTFNLNGAVNEALYVVDSNQIRKQYYVSKNVCHGVCYNQEMHEKLEPHKDKRVGLNLIYSGMSKYLQKHKNGKLFHDPLAACCLVNKSVCNFVEGNLYADKKRNWGFLKKNNTNKYISVSLNQAEFEQTLFE